MPFVPYTRRLGAFRGNATAPVKLHTAAAATTTIIRDLVLANGASVAGVVQVWIGPVDSPMQIFWSVSFAPSTAVHVDLRQELLAGEDLWLYANAQPCSALVTGYVFTD